MNQISTILNSLKKHYNNKYLNADHSKVKTIPIVKFPSNRFEMAAKFLSKIKGGKYLEIGAGDGSLALTLINNFSHLVLIDISEKRIEELSKLFDGKNVEILSTNLDHENLPYSDNTFDVVVMVDVIEHLIDPIGVCNEIYRVLKKRGGFC